MNKANLDKNELLNLDYLSAMKTYVLSNPFHLGPYGSRSLSPFQRIMGMSAANDTAGKINPSNILRDNTSELPEVIFEHHENSRPEIGEHVDSCMSMVQGSIASIAELPIDFDALAIIGGDHSISIGTGAALAQRYDMSKIGIVYVDTHGDCNIPETSLSKSITGYPLAVLMGRGHEDILKPFAGNFVQKVVHIGLRDLDPMELSVFESLNALSFSSLDCELLGMKEIIARSCDYLSDCESIWLSIDIDVLDPIYFQSGETDEPAPGGLTPREILTITHSLEQTGKLKITELVQINDIGENTPIIWLASRIIEASLGLGKFRYGG